MENYRAFLYISRIYGGTIMNICLLNDSFPPVLDGVANVVMNYGRIMQQDLGANVVVGTPKYPKADYTGYPYKVVAYPSMNTTKLVNGYRTGNPLAMREVEEMAKMEPDIIHTHCPAASTYMARVLQNEVKTKYAPIVFTYHTKFDVDITKALGEGVLNNETIKAMVNNIAACDEVWVVSEGAGENLNGLAQKAGLPFEFDCRVMANGVDFPKGTVAPEKVKEVTGQFDLPEGVPVFLFVGRMMKYKGLPLIIDALQGLSAYGVDFRMVFIGDGVDAKEMRRKVADCGIPMDIVRPDQEIRHYEGTDGRCGKVIFTGPIHDRENLRAWNTRADLFLFPSVYDTNGIVVREAAACGLASVLIKGSCAAEGITHDRNGFVIDENPSAMALLLADLARNPDHMKDVGQHAMDEIYISWDESTRAAYRRYEEILAMVADGTMEQRKKQSSDYLLEAASKIVKGTEHVFDIPRNIYGGMKENYEEWKEEVKELLPDKVVEIGDNISAFGDRVKETGKKIGENTIDGIKETVESVGDGMRQAFGKKNDDDDEDF